MVGVWGGQSAGVGTIGPFGHCHIGTGSVLRGGVDVGRADVCAGAGRCVVRFEAGTRGASFAPDGAGPDGARDALGEPLAGRGDADGCGLRSGVPDTLGGVSAVSP